MSRDQKKFTNNLEKLKYDNRKEKENISTCHLQTFPLIQWTLVIGKAGKDNFAIVCEFVCEV